MQQSRAQEKPACLGTGMVVRVLTDALEVDDRIDPS